MTSGEFLLALNQLGLTQRGLARILGVNERTVRDWAGERSPVPNAVALLLNLMIDTCSGAAALRT